MLKALAEYWPIINVFFGGFFVWVCWSLRQLAKNEIEKSALAQDKRLAQLDGRVDGHDTRLTKVEGTIEEIRKDIEVLPTKADFARLEGEVKGVGLNAAAAANGVQRIEGFFLKKGVESV
ncbi:hypothetical protein [Phenylobacterium sp.]|uniref:hypothetical protein n=1 Tax=Phenylobacterium sp. TaxID=1871053 RepID=UPI003919E8AC